MNELSPKTDDRDARLQRRLNLSLPVAALAAIGATSLYVVSSDKVDVRPSVAILEAPLMPSKAPLRSSYRVSDNGTLLRPDGEPAAMDATITGYVDSASIQGTRVSVSGWAADIKSKTPATWIVITLNEQSSFEIKPALPRTDVVAALDMPSAELSGYLMNFSVNAGDDVGQMRVRVFAVNSDGGAKELIYPADFPFRRQ
jgi:hypothetical protein